MEETALNNSHDRREGRILCADLCDMHAADSHLGRPLEPAQYECEGNRSSPLPSKPYSTKGAPTITTELGI